jgi:hypothetical protein
MKIRYILTVGVLSVFALDVVGPEWAFAARLAAVGVNLLWIWEIP